jgi:TolB protein
MGPRTSFRFAVALLAIGLLAACTVVGGVRRAPPTTAKPVPASASASAKPLPASLAQAKGWLAYSTFIGDDDRIHLTRPDGSQDHELFTDLQGNVNRADFSHDGRLAFENTPPKKPHNAYIAKADGTGARVIAKCEYGTCEREYPAWSPDSQQLVTTLALGMPTPSGPPPVFALSIINVKTQAVRIILKHPSQQFQEGLPRWSPDGRKLVFFRWRGTKDSPTQTSPDADAAVFTVNVDGTGLKQLTPWTLRCGDPDWSPDGSMIVCGSYPPYHFQVGQGELYALKPDGSDLHPLTKYGTSGPRAGHPRFTPDGKTILFVRASTRTWDTPPRHLYAFELASGQETPVLTKRDFYTRPSLQP